MASKKLLNVASGLVEGREGLSTTQWTNEFIVNGGCDGTTGDEQCSKPVKFVVLYDLESEKPDGPPSLDVFSVICDDPKHLEQELHGTPRLSGILSDPHVSNVRVVKVEEFLRMYEIPL